MLDGPTLDQIGDGLVHGTVGGGTLEAACQEKALELVASQPLKHRHAARE